MAPTWPKVRPTCASDVVEVGSRRSLGLKDFTVKASGSGFMGFGAPASEWVLEARDVGLGVFCVLVRSWRFES
jgi:hypothetical protein